MEAGHRWKRLTVSEAAESLQISKDAVRKRVQRGTLRHDKTLDGHVYVYLDANPAATGETSAENPDTAEQGRESRQSLTLGQASTLIAAAGALIYVLGVIALWAPIAKFYTNDFDTAWYAVSLFPRVVAAGQGVKQLPLPLVVLLATVARIFGWQYLFYKTKDKSKRRSYVWVAWLVSQATLLPYYVTFIRQARSHHTWGFYSSSYDIPQTGLVGWMHYSRLGLGLFISASVLTIMGLALERQWVTTRLIGLVYQSESPLPKIRNDRTLAIALALVLSYVIFVGITRVTLLTEPTLPYADISAQSHVDGHLLTHVDGFWYVFEDQGDRKGDLIAIPDDAVKTVRVHPRVE
jgi:hypothetical protein